MPLHAVWRQRLTSHLRQTLAQTLSCPGVLFLFFLAPTFDLTFEANVDANVAFPCSFFSQRLPQRLRQTLAQTLALLQGVLHLLLTFELTFEENVSSNVNPSFQAHSCNLLPSFIPPIINQQLYQSYAIIMRVVLLLVTWAIMAQKLMKMHQFIHGWLNQRKHEIQPNLLTYGLRKCIKLNENKGKKLVKLG